MSVLPVKPYARARLEATNALAAAAVLLIFLNEIIATSKVASPFEVAQPDHPSEVPASV